MMISPEYFYQINLEGKSVNQIEREIRRLKKEMTSLKKAIECMDPDEPRVFIAPSPEVQLKCARYNLA